MKCRSKSRAICASLLLFSGTQVAVNAMSLPPRFYHKTLVGANFVPILGMSTSGNVNPLDPSYTFNSNLDIDANIVFAGYSKSFVLFDRAAAFSYLQPMGSIEMDGTIGPSTVVDESSNGYGDPFFEFNINLIGEKPQITLADAMRYEVGLSVDMILDLSVPIGEYDDDQPVNMGQNRFWGRVGFPISYQIGEVWAPGHRTTFELLPAVWVFDDNDDYYDGSGGQVTFESDPTFTLAAHLTHDLNDEIWVGAHVTHHSLGDTEVDGVSGDGDDFTSFGLSIGTSLTRNLQMTLGYESTIGEDDDEIELNSFKISFVYFWADVLDGLHRLDHAH